MAMRTPTDSHHPHHQLKESGSTSRIENLSTSISELFTDVRLLQELITKIFLRLPVKSLMKSKCVSKPWLSFISSPQFIKSHFSKSSKEGEYLNHQLLYSSRDPDPGIKLCSLYSALQVPPAHVVSDIEYPSKNPVYPPRIIGIINGLVCFAIKASDLFLWNPVLRKSKQLPSSDMDVDRRFRSLNYGFGYDESNDDYKVVSLLGLSGSLAEIRVYSRRTDSWRRMEDWISFVPTFDDGIYGNGKIYWCVCNPSSPTPVRKIVSLDMLSGEYEELKMPDCEAGDRHWKLGVVGGQPYVLSHCYPNAKADLWLLDKFGVEESWCKVASIASDDVHPLKFTYVQKVVCILNNGEIVFGDGHGLYVYNSKRKELRNIELGVSGSIYYDIAVYVESLVLPNGPGSLPLHSFSSESGIIFVTKDISPFAQQNEGGSR